MKKFFFAALAALAIFAISCTKDGNGDVAQSELLGTWYMPGEEYHPSIVTFEKDGSYTWEYGGITGLKDTGKYTIKDNVITFNIADFWDIETEWVDGRPQNVGEWKKMDAENTKDNPRTRVVTVFVLDKPLLIWSVKNDWFYGFSDEEEAGFLMFMSSNKDELTLNKPVTESDLQGEWEGRNDKGDLVARLIINGKNFTSYNLVSNYMYDEATDDYTIKMSVAKEVGTFSVDKNEIKINYDTMYNSMKSELIDGKWVYSFSNYDPVTLEATEWLTEQPQGYYDIYVVYRDGANLYWGYGRGGAAFKKK